MCKSPPTSWRVFCGAIHAAYEAKGESMGLKKAKQFMSSAERDMT